MLIVPEENTHNQFRVCAKCMTILLPNSEECGVCGYASKKALKRERKQFRADRKLIEPRRNPLRTLVIHLINIFPFVVVASIFLPYVRPSLELIISGYTAMVGIPLLTWWAKVQYQKVGPISSEERKLKAELRRRYGAHQCPNWYSFRYHWDAGPTNYLFKMGKTIDDLPLETRCPTCRIEYTVKKKGSKIVAKRKK